jgi:hypothetical protein
MYRPQLVTRRVGMLNVEEWMDRCPPSPASGGLLRSPLPRDSASDLLSGAKSADTKAAIVEEFKDRATLLIATESAAEGVNLQFCSLVVNYDLPWNPQRIGRCHG